MSAGLKSLPATSVALIIVATMVFPTEALASETSHENAASQGRSKDDGSVIADYCLNIADKATDARIAWQTAQLNELMAQLDSRIALLDQRRAEVQKWVEQQQALLTAAETGLVEIYAKMDPEVAAAQLVTLDHHIASSLLRQLKPREASAILNEMRPEQAVPLVRMIAAATSAPGQGRAK